MVGDAKRPFLASPQMLAPIPDAGLFS